MDVGMSAFFQNFDEPARDRDIWREQVALADLAEPLGF